MSPARRLAALAAGLLVALGLTSVPAEAGLPVPVNCAQSPVELRWDDVTYDLNGTCGVVKVMADDVTRADADRDPARRPRASQHRGRQADRHRWSCAAATTTCALPRCGR